MVGYIDTGLVWFGLVWFGAFKQQYLILRWWKYSLPDRIDVVRFGLALDAGPLDF